MSDDNPRVNRYLADKTFDHMDHALGRPVWPERETYRNYFACGVDGTMAAAFAASPFWRLGGVDGTMAYYHVTAEGRAALAQHLRDTGAPTAWAVSHRGYTSIEVAASRAKAIYAAFLRWSDVQPDMQFIDFARSTSASKATA